MRIYNYINRGDGFFPNQDFTICCSPPLTVRYEYESGLKTANLYYGINVNDQEELVVRKRYEFVYDNATFVGIKTIIEWIDENGNVGWTKESMKEMSYLHAIEKLTKRP